MTSADGGPCDSTHVIIIVMLPVPQSATHLFYLRQYLKALPRAWTYLTGSPSSDVLFTLFGLDSSNNVVSVTHSRDDALVQYDEWVDNNVRNWPLNWGTSRVKRHVAYNVNHSTEHLSVPCDTLGPLCEPVAKSIESCNRQRERPVRLLYISSSPQLTMMESQHHHQQQQQRRRQSRPNFLSVPIDDLKSTLDFDAWVYLLSPLPERDFGIDAPDLDFLPRGLKKLASKPHFYERMATSVELHWELIYPGPTFKNFLCSATTPSVGLKKAKAVE